MGDVFSESDWFTRSRSRFYRSFFLTGAWGVFGWPYKLISHGIIFFSFKKSALQTSTGGASQILKCPLSTQLYKEGRRRPQAGRRPDASARAACGLPAGVPRPSRAAFGRLLLAVRRAVERPDMWFYPRPPPAQSPSRMLCTSASRFLYAMMMMGLLSVAPGAAEWTSARV